VLLYWSPYETTQRPLITYLISKGYWTSIQTDTPRWDVVFNENPLWKGGRGAYDDLLNRQDGGWVNWSNQNPNVAAALWPMVLSEMRSGRNDRIPRVRHLLLLAQQATDVRDFNERRTKELGP
jgi:hypothetical protein